VRTSIYIAVLGAVLSMTAKAAPIVLTFEGLQTEEQVLSYYNGGMGSLGSGPGPNFGITFNSDALAIINDDNSGGGNFAGNPSGDTALFFLSGAAATMDVPAGFDTGFSFFYSAINEGGTINVWSGLDDTGTLLTTITLPTTPSQVGSNAACTNPAEIFCPFFPLGVTFSGTAMSVDFGGTGDQIAFDDITLGSSTPGTGATAPEPASIGMIGLGLASLLGISRRRRKVN
jgi:PEP-CTERM motif